MPVWKRPKLVAVRLGGIGPIGPDRIPEVENALLIGVAVLNDEGAHAFRMVGEHSIADGAP
jgi:hypothetical protein